MQKGPLSKPPVKRGLRGRPKAKLQPLAAPEDKPFINDFKRYAEHNLGIISSWGLYKSFYFVMIAH